MFDLLKLTDFSLSAILGSAGPQVVRAESKLPIGKDGKPLKPCCACPETKRARDACIIEKGEAYCSDLIEQHKACMRSLGFKI